MSKQGEGVHGEERRHFPRYGLRLPIRLGFEEGGICREELSQFIDVSVGGACLPIRHSLGSGAEVTIRIDSGRFPLLCRHARLGDAAEIVIAGEVVRCEEDPQNPGYWRSGVRFKGPFRIIGGRKAEGRS